MKDASRNKFMLCFRPADASGDRSVRYIAPRKDMGTGPVQCAQKRSLISRAVRAVLHQNIWGKRARDNKGSRSSTRTNSLTSEESSSSSYASSDDNKTEDLRNQETKPNPDSESSVGTKRSFVESGALLFLISLATTVLWGRLCAILFTLIWLHFLSLPKGVSGDRRSDSPAAAVTRRSKKTRSDEIYSKKRVIMEGMLDRNHRRSEIERI